MNDTWFIRANPDGTATHTWYRNGRRESYVIQPTWWERFAKRRGQPAVYWGLWV